MKYPFDVALFVIGLIVVVVFLYLLATIPPDHSAAYDEFMRDCIGANYSLREREARCQEIWKWNPPKPVNEVHDLDGPQ